MTALALSEEQRTLIVGAAATVPPSHRQRFLDNVVDALMGRPAPTNDDVRLAIAAIKRALALGVGPPG
jgi:hypothetical protein